MNHEQGLIKIEQHEIKELIETTDSAVIYLGKSDCETCELNYPILEELAFNYNKKIYYYDATIDLQENHNDTISVIREYGVINAPSVIIAENGAVLGTYEGDVLEEIRAYLKNGSVGIADMDIGEVNNLSLIELDQMQETTDAGMIYFYRNDCSECKKSTPAIMEIVKKYNQEIYYYNTSVDRDNNYDEMIKVLESYNVTEIPAFVIYKDGKVIKSFGADNIILNVQDYLSNLK